MIVNKIGIGEKPTEEITSKLQILSLELRLIIHT